MNHQTVKIIVVAAITFFLGAASALILVAFQMKDVDVVAQNEAVTEEVEFESESGDIEAESHEAEVIIELPKFVLPYYVNQGDPVVVDIREPYGDLGEYAMSQEFIDRVILERSCEPFIDAPEDYSIWPWTLWSPVIGDDVECNVYYRGDDIAISLIGLVGGFESIGEISDAIILIVDGQPFLYDNIHLLATIEEGHFATEAFSNYPEAVFANEDWDAAYKDYTQKLRDYMADSEEIQWARNSHVEIITSYSNDYYVAE